MTAFVDVFWSFRSPYSYLATPQMLELKQNYDVDVNLRTVFPIAVRDPDFFNPDNAKRGRYIQMDWVRRAEFLGLPGIWPSPDPIDQDLKTFKIASDQPLIHRLSRLGIEAQRRGKGIEFAKEVSHLIFGGTKGWDQRDHLAMASARAGLDLADMEHATEGGDHVTEIEANQDLLEAGGHWGVPTFVFNREPFFGQDRIELLCWRLDQHNLRKAA